MPEVKEKETISQEQLAEFARMESNEVADSYRIVGKQGAGGCSVVYDAWRISDGRHVAIKVLALPEGLEYSEAEMTKKRFFREARILSSLKNEHSVECVEYGLFNGAPCVVLEFVDGMQLDTFLREFGALPFEYGVGIICQVLEALSEAHSKGIIHRDIKPANILVIQNSEPPVVRLIDFGIATLQEGALGELMRTRLGVVRGTPSYMAPELFTGQTSATPESDIYAIGLVLCEILTGTVCVSGASLMQIAFKQAHEELEIPALIPDCLAKIIRKCCEKNAADRYHSADELSKELMEVLPEACAQRASCEAAYLKSIQEGKSDKKVKKGLPKPLLIALVAVIVGLAALFAFTHMKSAEEAELLAAQKAEQDKLHQDELKKAEEEKAAAEKAAAEAQAKAAADAEALKKANDEAIAKAAAEAAQKAAAEATAKAEADFLAKQQQQQMQEELEKARREKEAAERRAKAAEENRRKAASRPSSPAPAPAPVKQPDPPKKPSNNTGSGTIVPTGFL